jgi:hypothetical protein
MVFVRYHQNFTRISYVLSRDGLLWTSYGFNVHSKARWPGRFKPFNLVPVLQYGKRPASHILAKILQVHILACILPYNKIFNQLLKEICFGLHSVGINQQFNASSPIPAALGSFYPTNPHLPPRQIPKKQCSVNTSYFCQEVTLGAAEYCKTGITLKGFNQLDPTAHKFVSCV